MPHTAPKATSYDTSLFCIRLKKLSGKGTPALKNLNTATEKLVSHAEAISRLVVRHLPQFTLHDGTHLWNVLGFMEELAGGSKGIAKLGAGDCAMAIWAAFIHDLGMVLEASELAALDAADHFDTTPGAADGEVSLPEQRVQDWRAYRDGHAHWRSIRRDPHSALSRWRLGIVRASFIRDTHARIDTHTGHCRIADWLKNLSTNDRLIAQALDDYSLDERLVRVAVSHNQDIHWLPRQLKALGGDDSQTENFGPELGSIHWSWIGWLLRLADVFDCDASRTPPILFDYSGITDFRSATEWKKHLAIPASPQWEAGSDKETLLYLCQKCPGPVVEKSLHQIVGWMNDEIGVCQAAWQGLSIEQRTGIELNLPSRAVLEIRNRQGNYIYQDIEFRLDRDAVVELLMGESLYGGHELALRELVQNALDAVHLRDQRNKLDHALEKAGGGEKARHPHAPWGALPPGVRVTWGREEDGRQWIKVRDNGVGMTVGTMRRFLTQVGKSYYKSDDFLAEQELMRRHGILCTAISQFGIGFLSVFMLADHVEIHTRPAGATDHADTTKPNWQETERFPFRADIHGPHGLLAFYPEAVPLTGTTVTLWLKKHPADASREQFYLPEWNRELTIARLRQEFYKRGLTTEQEAQFKELSNKAQSCEPAFEIGRFIVWPLYPVEVGPAGQSLLLDHSFHLRELIPLDTHALDKQAREVDEVIPEVSLTTWQCCDWGDRYISEKGVEGTGSRIRLVAPMPAGDTNRPVTPAQWSAEPDQLSSGKPRLLLPTFAEAQLPGASTRYQCLVNGVRIVPGFVPSSEERDCHLPAILEQFPLWPGAGAWVWLDLRGSAMPRLRADRSSPVRSQAQDWDLASLFQRWVNSFSETLPAWLCSVAPIPEFDKKISPRLNPARRIGLSGVSVPVLKAALVAENKVKRDRFGALPVNHGSLDYRFLGLNFNSDLDINLPRIHDLVREDARDLDLDFASRQLELRLDQLDALRRRVSPVSCKANYSRMVNSHLAGECFWPSLEQSHVALGLNASARSGLELNSCQLIGPLHVAIGPSSELPEWLSTYDLVTPFTSLSLPRFRSSFIDWTVDRRLRGVLMIPFFFGSRLWHESVREKLIKRLSCKRLMLFLPNPSHEEWLFADYSKEEWAAGSASALWDMETGQVFYADSIHTEESLRREGQPLRKWLDIS